MVHLAVALLFFALVAAAAVSDLRSRTIPNDLSIALLLLYPAHVVASPAPVAWPAAAGLAAAVLAAALVPFARGWMGGGDVKLLAAIALWAGPAQLPAFLLVTSFAGGLLAMLMLGGHQYGIAAACRMAGLPRLGDAFLDRAIPYALAIAAGAAAGCGPALLAGL